MKVVTYQVMKYDALLQHNTYLLIKQFIQLSVNFMHKAC